MLWLLPMAHHFVVSILLYLRVRRDHPAALRLASRAPCSSSRSANARASLRVAPPLPAARQGRVRTRASRSVRLAISTADGLRPEIAERFAERFGHPLAQALGIIEVGLPVVNLARAATKPGALGQPLPDYEVWLRGEDGRPSRRRPPPSARGEICIRGPGLLDAYLDPWLPARDILEPDGFRTGDQGWFDADGDLHLAGRRANRISMAGMKFFGEEVEAVLDAIPGVRAEPRPRPGAPPPGRDPGRRDRARGSAPPRPPALPSAPSAAPGCPATRCRASFELVAELPLTATGKLART